MTAGKNREDEPVAIVVTDRRRFTETGEERKPAEEAAAPPQPAPAEAQAVPEPASAGPQERLVPEPSDLGIQAVFLIFYQSAMMALGAPDEMGRRMEPDLAQAREAIELLRVLEQSTRGNLTAQEDALLKQMLREVQMAFVHVAGSGPGGGRA